MKINTHLFTYALAEILDKMAAMLAHFVQERNCMEICKISKI